MALSTGPSEDHVLSPKEETRLVEQYPQFFQQAQSVTTYKPSDLLRPPNNSATAYDHAHVYLTLNGADDEQLEDIMTTIFGYYIPPKPGDERVRR